jgi:hypothetical protein
MNFAERSTYRKWSCPSRTACTTLPATTLRPTRARSTSPGNVQVRVRATPFKARRLPADRAVAVDEGSGADARRQGDPS